MDTYLSFMNPQPNTPSKNSLETNNTLQYSDPSLELQTITSNNYQSHDLGFASNGACLAPRDLSAKAEASVQDCGRERLKKHRSEVAGWVLIPDRWGQEEVMREWIDYSSFNELLAPNGLMSAREALARDGRRASSRGFSTIDYRERC